VASSGSSVTGSAESADGVNLVWVMPSRRSSASISGPGTASVASGRYSAAPAASAEKISATDASKCSGASSSERELDSSPSTRTSSGIRLHALRCSTPAPLGMPVEPEV
jgi:hypothetical protein